MRNYEDALKLVLALSSEMIKLARTRKYQTIEVNGGSHFI